MRYLMRAYIDSFQDITFLVNKRSRYKAKRFYLFEEDNCLEELTMNYQVVENNLIKIGLRVTTKLHLYKNYYICDDLKHRIPLYSGSVVRTTEFESKYYYNGKLGVEYHKDASIFRVWSPVAKSILLHLSYQDGRLDRKELTYQGHGVWSIEIFGDLDGVCYVYYVKVFDRYEKVLDPYAISSTANREANYVIDPQKLYSIKHIKPYFSGLPMDAVVYEASIRDLTSDLPAERKGSFLGLIDDDEDKGLNYISSLGVTHLQLMPCFDFGGVNDEDKDRHYNWGYNPEQYFVPSGWYSCQPRDPYSRLNEFLCLIDECHKRGMRVVMDVVYNHVYNMRTFPFEKLVPGYFFRVDAYGNYTNTSGCGNDLATEKRMCSRFIIDNLLYWAINFQISGFRFDLMGLLDIDTMKYAYKQLKEIDPNILLYGEGWNMPNTIPDSYRPHAYNHFKLPHYGFFNDKYRDYLKGSQWNKSKGFVFGEACNPKDVFHLMGGSVSYGYHFQNPNQSVNYVECHDNYTLYDFGVYALGLSEKEAIVGGRLALQMIAISSGMVFFHAGQEFYRTKKGVENSYNSLDKINHFDYERKEYFKDDIEGLRELLHIRRYYKELRISNGVDLERNRIFMEELSNEHVVCYYIDAALYRLTIVIKNTKDPFPFLLHHAEMIFDGHRATSLAMDTYTLEDVGVYIFKEEKI